MALILTNKLGEKGCAPALAKLQQGAAAIDCVEQGLVTVENDPTVPTIGYGGFPNVCGEMELDASIMDGDTFQTGAVGAVKGFRNPILIARRVLEDLPHEVIVGEGAAQFARECGFSEEEILEPSMKKDWEDWFQKTVSPQDKQQWPHVPLIPYVNNTEGPAKMTDHKDTVIFLAIDEKGTLASGASTSGWPNKYPGRLGDTPITGAGHYCDSRYGAAACTHTGEMAIRKSTARSMVLYMKMGLSVEEAVHEALKEIHELQGGFLNKIVLYATDKKGNFYSASNRGQLGDAHYFVWKEGMAKAEMRECLVKEEKMLKSQT